MVRITVQPDLSCPSNAYLAWDTRWNKETQQGDWAVATDGSLAASRGIATCVILALMTDKQCPADHPLAPDDGDLRGWWATPLLIAQGVPEMGSLLWLLENKSVNETNRRYAETFALDALAPLLSAGLAVKATATATILPQGNGVTLAVALYGSDGARIYAAQFDVVWAQIGR
jgi:phage gp46-like protein